MKTLGSTESVLAAHVTFVLCAAWSIAACAAPVAAADKTPPAEIAAAAQALPLSFADIFQQPIGPGGLQFTPALLAADGQRVRLRGFMVANDRAPPGLFLLTPRPVRLHTHADGEADDLPPATVQVVLDPGQRHRRVAHRAGPIEVVGRLSVGRQEDEQGRVAWLRLQLAPEALAERPAPIPLPHLH